jgi:hypothetical protein
MFCASGLLLSGIEGVGSRFHVLISRTRFRWYRGHRVLFSYFALPDSFSVVPRASGPVLKICAPGLIFDGAKLGPVFMFCAPGLILGGTEGVGYSFHVLRFRTRFGRYRGPRVPVSCFVLPDSFWAVPRALVPVFMCCAPRLIFGGTVGAGSYFGLPDPCWAVPRASGPIFIFCSLGLIFDGTEDAMSRFHVLRPPKSFRAELRALGLGVSMGTVRIGWRHFHYHTHVKLLLPIPYPYPLKLDLPIPYPYPLK